MVSSANEIGVLGPLEVGILRLFMPGRLAMWDHAGKLLNVALFFMTQGTKAAALFLTFEDWLIV
jgi:hypothetical protein